MRGGRMLVEGSPKELMGRYESELLEQVVMQICRLDQGKTGTTSSTAENCKSEQSKKLKFKSSWKKNNQIAYSNELEGDFRALPSGDFEKGCHGNQSLKKKSERKYSNFLHSLQKTFEYTWVIFIIFFRYPG